MKNRFSLKKFWSIFALALMALVSVSCNGREGEQKQVKAPTDEYAGHGHEKWGKLEIFLHEGHGHGGGSLHRNHAFVDLEILPILQKITFTQTEKGVEWKRENRLARTNKSTGQVEFYDKLLDKDAPFEVLATRSEGIGYAMEIVYYNNHGERINSQFLNPAVTATHQHFFFTHEYTDLNGKVIEKKEINEGYIDHLYSYYYRDTTKEDEMIKDNAHGGTEGTGTLSNSLLGLKGNFFFKKDKVRFNMHVRMTHVVGFPKDPDIPANNPPIGLMDKTTEDFHRTIPFVVIGTSDPRDITDYYEAVSQYYNLGLSPLKTKEFLLNQLSKKVKIDGKEFYQ
ncbi:MAG: hypothetical protein Q4A00_00230 [Flavobacteriaceae bacterium]|nr:hypothetical protein [Flavobacteriaceae bacterium]